METGKMKKSLRNIVMVQFLVAFVLMLILSVPVQAKKIAVKVDASSTVRKMAGGIGASWHTMRKEYKETDGGSSWGGNPPLDFTAEWQAVYDHASWLGLNWMRVEIRHQMFEPQRKQFDFDNEEMQTLYRVLDWCQENDVDVFLQNQWNEVEWNSYDFLKPMHSAPKSMEDFGEGMATLIEYLIKEKKYTCLRWFCITNEPAYCHAPKGYDWWRNPQGSMSIAPGLKAVRAALDKRGIDLPLSGPDWVQLPGVVKLKKDLLAEIQDYVGGYDIHVWMGINESEERDLAGWAKWAHEQNKPFFLSEIGDARLGGLHYSSSAGPRSYQTTLSLAEIVLRGINAGVDGFSRWSFLNRGDIDGQFQLIRTWDMEKKRHLKDVEPEPVPYFGFAMLTRFMAKYSDVLKCEVDKQDQAKVLAQAVRSPRGNLTLIVLNLDDTAHETAVEISGLKGSMSVYRYQLTEAKAEQSDFKLEPEKEFKSSKGVLKFTEKVPAMSITTYSTYKLSHSEPGITAD